MTFLNHIKFGIQPKLVDKQSFIKTQYTYFVVLRFFSK